MDELAKRFEESGPHLRRVAYRMLGSLSEAEDAVQEAWIRLGRTDATVIANLRGWLTTVVARVCLDVLRSRASRNEEPLTAHLPDPIVSNTESELADSIGLAMLVVLETLAPAERLAFVLHDMFAVPFEEIAGIVNRTPTAARQLASRARRRVQGEAPQTDADLAQQRVIVDAFLAASRNGDFAALVALLDPDVVLRGDRGAGSRIVRGAEHVAKGAVIGAARANGDRVERHVIVNGTAGVVVTVDGKPFSIAAFTIRGGRIVEIDVLADPARLVALAA